MKRVRDIINLQEQEPDGPAFFRNADGDDTGPYANNQDGEVTGGGRVQNYPVSASNVRWLRTQGGPFSFGYLKGHTLENLTLELLGTDLSASFIKDSGTLYDDLGTRQVEEQNTASTYFTDVVQPAYNAMSAQVDALSAAGNYFGASAVLNAWMNGPSENTEYDRLTRVYEATAIERSALLSRIGDYIMGGKIDTSDPYELDYPELAGNNDQPTPTDPKIKRLKELIDKITSGLTLTDAEKKELIDAGLDGFEGSDALYDGMSPEDFGDAPVPYDLAGDLALLGLSYALVKSAIVAFGPSISGIMKQGGYLKDLLIKGKPPGPFAGKAPRPPKINSSSKEIWNTNTGKYEVIKKGDPGWDWAQRALKDTGSNSFDAYKKTGEMPGGIQGWRPQQGFDPTRPASKGGPGSMPTPDVTTPGGAAAVSGAAAGGAAVGTYVQKFVKDVINWGKGKNENYDYNGETIFTLTESRKRILKNIKKPYEVPELPKKYKMNFAGKYSAQNTPDKTASQVSDELVASGNARGQRWRQKDKDWVGYETSERMNLVYDKVGHGDQYWNMIVSDNLKKKRDRELQEQLNIIAHEKALVKENPNYETPFNQNKIDEQETLSADKDPLFKKVSKSLKKEIDYSDKPSKNGYPNDPPPKTINGYHPDLVNGQRVSKYYNGLDPHSAEAMSPTGNPEIDAKAKEAMNLKAKARKLKTLLGKGA